MKNSTIVLWWKNQIISVYVLKFQNPFLYLFSNKMLIIRAGIHRRLVRIANTKTMSDQTASSEAVSAVCLGLYRQATSVQSFRTSTMGPLCYEKFSGSNTSYGQIKYSCDHWSGYPALPIFDGGLIGFFRFSGKCIILCIFMAISVKKRKKNV